MAKLPSGRGSWAAAWALPQDWEYGPWPHSGEIDIFEAGPTYSCETESIRAINQSKVGKLTGNFVEDPKDTLIATYEPFRCCRGKAEYWDNQEIHVDADSIKKLQLSINDKIRIYFL